MSIKRRVGEAATVHERDLEKAVGRVPQWRDAPTDLTRLPRNAVNLGSTLPFMALRPVQTTCSAVDLSWMGNVETCAKQRVNSRKPPPGFRVEAARSGGICETPLDVGSI